MSCKSRHKAFLGSIINSFISNDRAEKEARLAQEEQNRQDAIARTNALIQGYQNNNIATDYNNRVIYSLGGKSKRKKAFFGTILSEIGELGQAATNAMFSPKKPITKQTIIASAPKQYEDVAKQTTINPIQMNNDNYNTYTENTNNLATNSNINNSFINGANNYYNRTNQTLRCGGRKRR